MIYLSVVFFLIFLNDFKYDFVKVLCVFCVNYFICFKCLLLYMFIEE